MSKTKRSTNDYVVVCGLSRMRRYHFLCQLMARRLASLNGSVDEQPPTSSINHQGVVRNSGRTEVAANTPRAVALHWLFAHARFPGRARFEKALGLLSVRDCLKPSLTRYRFWNLQSPMFEVALGSNVFDTNPP